MMINYPIKLILHYVLLILTITIIYNFVKLVIIKCFINHLELKVGNTPNPQVQLVIDINFDLYKISSKNLS